MASLPHVGHPLERESEDGASDEDRSRDRHQDGERSGEREAIQQAEATRGPQHDCEDSRPTSGKVDEVANFVDHDCTFRYGEAEHTAIY